MNARSYGPQGPLDPVAQAMVQALAGNPAWQAMTRRPVAETRAALAETLFLLPPPEPVHHVEDFRLPVAGGDILARLYLPGEAPGALILWYHGGGFLFGSVADSDNFTRHLANMTGAAVLSVDYRLAPEHRFPTAIEDCVGAARWAIANGAALGLPRLPVYVGGDSAGGNLAAVAARLLTRDGAELAGQILVYPCTDNAEAASLRRFTPPFLTADELAWMFDHYVPDPGQRRDPRFAPLHADDLAGLPPAILITAEHDLLTEQAEEYGHRMTAAGVPVEISRHAGQFHGFFTMDAFYEGEAGRAMRAILAFMARTGARVAATDKEITA